MAKSRSGTRGRRGPRKPPRRDEREQIDAALDRALAVWPLIAKGDWNTALSHANIRQAKPKQPASPLSSSPSGGTSLSTLEKP